MRRSAGAAVVAAILTLAGGATGAAAQGWPGYWPPGGPVGHGALPYAWGQAPYGWPAAPLSWSISPFGGLYQVVGPADVGAFGAGAYPFNATSCPRGTVPVAGTPWRSVCVDLGGATSGGVSEPAVAVVEGAAPTEGTTYYPPGMTLCYSFPPRPC